MLHLTFPPQPTLKPTWRWRLRSYYNRLRRGVLAFVPHLIQPDEHLAHAVLTASEYGLFQQMDVRDKQHALWVAKALLEHHPRASDTLVAAALLHDVGKCDAPFRPLERIIVHLLAQQTKHYPPNDALYAAPYPPAYPRQTGWRGAWQCKCHHERYGAERIAQAGGRKQVAAIIAACHVTAQDPEARLLAHIDACF